MLRGSLFREPVDLFACHEVSGKHLAFPNRFKERAGSKASPNDQSANAVGDVNNPVNKFDLWHIFQEDRRIKSTVGHNPLPRRSNTEQQRNGLQQSVLNNPFNALAPDFPRTATFESPIGSFPCEPRGRRVSVGPKPFHNDNEPDWREAA